MGNTNSKIESPPEYSNIRLRTSTKELLDELKNSKNRSYNLMVLELIRCYKMFGNPINEETDPEYANVRLRKYTKNLLDEVKGNRSYDLVLQDMVDCYNRFNIDYELNK